MAYKFLGSVIVGAAIALLWLVLKDDGIPLFGLKDSAPCSTMTPAEQLNKLINDDFQKLQKKKLLPKEWKSIATVEIRMNSQLAKSLLGKTRPQFQRIKEGKTFLELEIMDLTDEENPGIIIQASLFDIKSKNKIFEIGRTYTMNDLNHPESKKSQ